MAGLRITLGDKTAELTLTKNIKAGRNPDNDLPLPVKEASRVHFMLGRLKEGGWAVRDLGSTNGTMVNGEMIGKITRLWHKDVIQLGPQCTITYWDPEAVREPAPEPEPEPQEPKRPSGPIVLKSRAQKRKDKEDEERRQRSETRKTNRAAQKAQEAEAAPAPVDMEMDKTAEIEAPVREPDEVIEIESEAMLDSLIKDAAAADTLLKGDKEVRFGPYTIRSRMAEGGMGYVVKAYHRKLKAIMALKLLRTEKVDENNIARFKQEAWAISAFDHPNIVKVRDLGQHAGMHYIAMDYIDGADLLKVGFEGTLTFWQVMETIDKMADVLKPVHARNILHRDLKPQNILLDKRG